MAQKETQLVYGNSGSWTQIGTINKDTTFENVSSFDIIFWLGTTPPTIIKGKRTVGHALAGINGDINSRKELIPSGSIAYFTHIGNSETSKRRSTVLVTE